MIASEEATKAQIDRILQSEALRSSEGLRRLLKFLADKALSGDAEQLKEYTIGIDAFCKPASYDPRQDSTVRILAGRLRHRLTEYYRTEGKDDPIIVDLPKGHYKLNWQARPRMETVFFPARRRREPSAGAPQSRSVQALMLACLVMLAGWATYATIRMQAEHKSAALYRSQWPREIATIWGSFVDDRRHLLISISAPLFVELPGYGFFRDESVNHPDDVAKSPAIAAVAKALHIAHPEPYIDYGTLGVANASFVLGKMLAPRKANMSIVNGTDLSWRQVSENNVIFIGSPRFFNQQLDSMPAKTDLYLEPGVGIRNIHPRMGESALFTEEGTHVTGVGWVLVSRLPGPGGNTDVMSFAGRSGPSISGAVDWFTQASTARELLARLRKPSGKIPRYYQVLLKVRFQDGVALETSYILHMKWMDPASVDQDRVNAAATGVLKRTGLRSVRVNRSPGCRRDARVKRSPLHDKRPAGAKWRGTPMRSAASARHGSIRR